MNRKLDKTPELKREYDGIINEQLTEGVVEVAPEIPTRDRQNDNHHKGTNGIRCRCKT